MPRWARRLIVGLGTAVIVAAVSGGTLGVLGAAAGSGADAGRAAAAFAGLALGVGTPLALVHALVVAPLAAKARHAAWAFVTHLVGGALLASLLSVTLAPVGALGGAVFFALERRYGSE
ncbi:hypothetical protein [Deinococcus yavapaiensis]|uniref:hypothetical protein n=1 Tax=Deinococcus yavapaiensis TaxID=309889 RepID=UPI00147335E4|nr:hypothetical protein [Deinococcus yavapaiensis]